MEIQEMQSAVDRAFAYGDKVDLAALRYLVLAELIKTETGEVKEAGRSARRRGNGNGESASAPVNG